MSELTKLKRILLLCKNPQVIFGNKEYIFIISHMRSRSSLLSHLLGSNPAISGHSELHSAYLNFKDLIRLQARVHYNDKCKPNFKFALDSLLWNKHRISEKICLKKNLKVIFLLRKPKSTLKSIINLGNMVEHKNYKTPEWGLNYYCDRLRTIKDYALKIPQENSLFIDSDKIVQDTKHTLDYLSNWLSLTKKLTPDYLVFKNTGKRNSGDPLNNLKEGKIIKDISPYKDIHISPIILDKAKKAYESCRKVLLEHCKNF